MKAKLIENHPQDSRVRFIEDGICQSLTERMGTGGGNTPLVLTYRKVRRAKSDTDFETWEEADISNTINLFDVGDSRATTLVIDGREDNADGKEIL